jgi:hypothetical protein
MSLVTTEVAIENISSRRPRKWRMTPLDFIKLMIVLWPYVPQRRRLALASIPALGLLAGLIWLPRPFV